MNGYLDPNINLSPAPVLNDDGTIRHPGMDNHAMGTVFEELVRKFNEENNEEAGEHWTPRDAVRLMATLIFRPVADQIKSGGYLIYDCACGTGGMLTVAEETLFQLAAERGKQITTHLYGQEINPETYAICKADMLLKGEGENADHIVGGPEHSTLANDAFPAQEFDFMLSNPPYGKSWKKDLETMGGKDGVHDPRFKVMHQPACHDGSGGGRDEELSLLTRSSDGQMLFLANMASKMNHKSPLGSRIAEVHNGSSLFTGDAGQGESNIRRWLIENDWLEAIVALPLNLFYNTGIATYIWVLTNRKPEHRRGKVQLIDATRWFKPLRKNLGKKNCELAPDDIERISRTFLDFQETPESKIFSNAAFGYWKVTVERPLRLHSRLTVKAIESLRFASGDEDLRTDLYEAFGDALFGDFSLVSPKVEAFLTSWSDPAVTTDDTEAADDAPKKGLPEKKRRNLLDPNTWKRDGRLVDTATMLRNKLGDRLYEDHNEFRDLVDAVLQKAGIKLSATERKLILKATSWRDESAPPVIAKTHKPGKTKPAPLHGLFEGRDGSPSRPLLVEYEPDPDLRDTEQIPFLEAPPSDNPGGLPTAESAQAGIESFFRREVLPYTPDLPAPRPTPGQFCVYVLKCADDSFYIGQTDNFARRLKQHENDEVSWTAPRLPVEPIHWEVLPSREEAVKRESELKTGFGRQWLKKQYSEGKLYAPAARQAGAWIKADATKIGYEISFTRHFYKPQPLRTLEEIAADILAVEKEAEGLLDGLLKGVKA